MKLLANFAKRRGFCLMILGGTFITAVTGQESKPAAREQIQALAANYRAERDRVVKEGIAQRFPPVLLDKADEMAKRAEAALHGGRLLQAAEALRQARWQLPYQPARVPDHVVRILGNMRLRHANDLLAVAFSPDGSKLASASRDHTVKVWDLANGHELLTYTGHGDAVRAIAFSPDGKSIASGGADKGIKIWDAATGKDLLAIKGEGVETTSIAYARDGQHVIAAQGGAAAQNPGLLLIYETATGKLKRSITDFRARVAAVAFNFDGSILGAAADDGQVRLWQYPAMIDKVNQPDYWSQQDPNIHGIAFSPDNRAMARLGPDGVKLYNLVLPGASFQVASPRRTIAQVKAQSRVTCAIFGKDSKSLFTGGADGTIRVWDTESGQLTATFKGHNGDVKSLALNSAGNQLASASTDYTIRLWDFQTVAQARDFTGHEGAVWTSSFSPDGQRIVSAGADRTVRIWDVGTGKTLHSLNGHTSAVTAALFSPGGKTVLSGAGDKLIRLWDAQTGQPLRAYQGHTATITALDFSRDGNQFVSGSADKTVRLWDTASGKALFVIHDNNSIVAALALSPDGRQIAVGNVDQTIRLYDAATGKQRAGWQAHGVAVSGVCFSPDGQWLASCGVDQLVRVWPLATPGKNSITLTGHTGPLSAVAFHADSKHIASTGSDQTVRLWKLDNGAGKEAQTYRGHRDWVTSVSFSKDGYYVVSSGVDRSIKIWEITSKEIPLLAEHTGKIDAAAYSPDGKMIATGASDKTIKIWDRQTGLESFTLSGHTDGITSLTFTPDSKTLISSSEDRSIRIWDVGTGKEMPRLPGQQQAFTGLSKPVSYMTIAPDGKKLLTWVYVNDRYTTLAAFDLATGTELFSVNDQGRNINSFAFSADGTRAATGALDGSVRVFDLDKKGTLLPGGDWFLYEKGVGLGDLAFSPDGGILVAGSNAGDVKICRIANKETLKTIKAHDSRVVACQMSSDGKRFATVGMNKDIKLWDLASGKELRRWDIGGVGENVVHFTPLAFSPDNKHLVAGNADTTAYVLDLP